MPILGMDKKWRDRLNAFGEAMPIEDIPVVGEALDSIGLGNAMRFDPFYQLGPGKLLLDTAEDIEKAITPKEARKRNEARKRGRQQDKRRVSSEPHELYYYRKKVAGGLSDAAVEFNNILKAKQIPVPGTEGRVTYKDLREITARAWRELDEFNEVRRLLEDNRGVYRFFNDGTPNHKGSGTK
jgi:hypothetical protein